MDNKIEATKQHCRYCFEVLESKLTEKPLPQYPKQLEDRKLPIFVTWLYDGELRGCIGTFSHQHLSKVLQEYALVSALEDDRFDPIDIKQIEHLSVGVSFLVDFVPNLQAYDWEVGTHGIILNLNRQGRKYQATFLPEVAEEEHWDKKTTLKHLLRKAGCNVPLAMVENDIKITSYQSSKCEMKYEQYKAMKPKEQEKEKKSEVKKKVE